RRATAGSGHGARCRPRARGRGSGSRRSPTTSTCGPSVRGSSSARATCRAGSSSASSRPSLRRPRRSVAWSASSWGCGGRWRRRPRPEARRPGSGIAAGARSGRMVVQALKLLGLFVATALAEIVGCYLPYLWLRQGKPAWLLLPAALSLAAFVWLLTLHPHAAGRVYAAYGGVYICVALAWLWAVDAIRPGLTDWIGVGVCLLGAGIIMLGPRG